MNRQESGQVDAERCDQLFTRDPGRHRTGEWTIPSVNGGAAGSCWTTARTRASIGVDTMWWAGYSSLWVTFALVWAIAASLSSGRAVPEMLLYGVVGMAAAGVMGLGVRRLTASVPLNWRSARFYGPHCVGLAAFSVGYSCSWLPLEMARGGVRAALDYASPALPWNAMMGSWLYLLTAAMFYAERDHQALREQQAAAARAQLLAQQAQLAALRSQVNPHFLFNALHSISALISMDPQKADDAIERLGDLLRYALGAEDLVPMRDEWRFTLDYLALEQLRLGSRLRVTEHLGPGAGACSVPPLILQPLVENAIRHGISQRTEGGHIRLSASSDGESLVVRVSDDGSGASGDDGLGIGLDVVRRRLSASYGGRADLTVSATVDGFHVEMRLPDDEEPVERT